MIPATTVPEVFGREQSQGSGQGRLSPDRGLSKGPPLAQEGSGPYVVPGFAFWRLRYEHMFV